MSSNISAVEKLNRINFGNTFAPLRNIITPFLYWTLMVGDVIMFIFFICDFCKRNSHYRKPFYILLVIGFGIHFWDNIFSNYVRGYLQSTLKVPYMQTVFYIRKTYFVSFFSFWNATLVLNKFTALWFPLKHDKIWSKNFKKILGVMLGVPFLPLIYIYVNSNCIDPSFFNNAEAKIVNECTKRNSEGTFIASAFIYILIIFLIILITVYHKKTISTLSPQIAKIEKRLMFQAMISLILYGIYRTIEIIGTNLCLLFDECSPQFYDNYHYLTTWYFMLSDIIKYIPYLVDISLLIIISKTFRSDFFNFYSFGYYQKYSHKKLFIRTAAVTNLTAAAVPTTNKSTKFEKVEVTINVFFYKYCFKNH